MRIGNMGIAAGIAAVVLLAGTCDLVNQEDPVDNDPVVTDTLEESFGTVTIKLDGSDSGTSFLGRINDGPQPPLYIWEEVDAVGACKLYKPVVPFCSEKCGSLGACVAEDSCQPFPEGVNVGTMTVTGLKLTDGASRFTVDPVLNNYQFISIDDVDLQFPPAAEGEVITISAAGGEGVANFEMSVQAIKPLVLLNDSLPCGDGQDIDLRWEGAADPSQSLIHYLVDVSHHGGTKGKIEGICSDNGSFTIPATLLDQLKSFGIFGYPEIEVTRRATGVNATVKSKVVMESKVTMLLSIPGVYSCEEESDCPDGMTCGMGFKCE